MSVRTVRGKLKIAAKAPSSLDIDRAFFHDDPGMMETVYSRPYLESLSTDELIQLADKAGIDIPPHLDRIFIISELLEYGEVEEAYADDTEESPPPQADYIDAVPLVKQYNITYIEVLIRDPLWAFVFWEAASGIREIHENALDFGGYSLLVSPAHSGKGRSEDSFEIPVGIEDMAWYIGFPPELRKAGERGMVSCYQVQLCASREFGRVSLCESAPFTMPALQGPPSQPDTLSPLAALSGAAEFRVTCLQDRKSRFIQDY
ncbi:MAG: DUF4912 domain-containing protein [Treponema sp.]|nr:DUF4912 domain-containing protein [Treponema sp.]